MSDKKTLRRQILDLVCEFHAADAPHPFRPGEDPVRYAGRYFDEQELVNLVDSSLDFWLTAGRYADEFEAGLAEFLGL
ncbi:MAG: lipopolysaccharide biosynthesis protein RfbH, partial [Verrucomicrobiota bacterium]